MSVGRPRRSGETLIEVVASPERSTLREYASHAVVERGYSWYAWLIPLLPASFVAVGVDPAVMGIGPIPAVQKLLEKTGLTIKDIDLFEVNANANRAIRLVYQDTPTSLFHFITRLDGPDDVGRARGLTDEPRCMIGAVAISDVGFHLFPRR